MKICDFFLMFVVSCLIETVISVQMYLVLPLLDFHRVAVMMVAAEAVTANYFLLFHSWAVGSKILGQRTREK